MIYYCLSLLAEIFGFAGEAELQVTFWRLAQWRISEYKTVNTPQKLMRGRMFN
jgi:hypothetical protein